MRAPRLLEVAVIRGLDLPESAVEQGIRGEFRGSRMIGMPTTSSMKIVRRDHSISPSERSNTRLEAAKYDMRGAEGLKA